MDNYIKDFQFNFDVTSFNDIFPFYILIGKDLKIKSFGKSIKKILPNLKQNLHISDTFSIRSPNIKTLLDLNSKDTLGQLVVWDSLIDKSISLRGQISLHNENYLFVGIPCFKVMEKIIEKKLTLDDFAICDPLLDLLDLIKSKEINNLELKKLLNTVNLQNNNLKKDKKELQKFSLVASANNSGTVFTDSQGKIFWCNESYLSLTGFLYDEIIGKTLVEVCLCELYSRDEINKMLKAFYNDELFEVEILHAHKTKNPFWSKLKGQPVFNNQGKLIQYFTTIEDVTFEKENEHRLSILSSIAEKNINAVIICDNSGLTEWVNDSFSKLTGFTKEELIGKKPGELLQGEESSKEKILYLSQQIKKGLPFNCEIINYNKKREKFWVKIQGQALRDKKGEIVKYFAIQEDITLQKKFNQKIFDSENKLNSLIKNLQTGVLLVDSKRKIIVLNKIFCDMFNVSIDSELIKGFDCKQLSNASMHLFKNPKNYIKRINEIQKNKVKINGEEIELLDGKVYERSYLPIYKERIYDGHLWSYNDITIKKKYKESIEAEKEKYSNIIAHKNMGLLEVDNNDTVLFANESFCEMSGFSFSELIGKKGAEILIIDKDKNIILEKNRLRTQGISDSYEVRIKTKKGDMKYWLICGAPNYNVNGELIGSIGVHLDITQKKLFEIQKEDFLIKLEKQNQKLNEYAQMVSHDLKSPLQSIHSLITWIKEDNDKEFNKETTQYLNLIESKVEKMDHLIQGILTYSKVDSEEMITEKVDLNDVIKSCINIIHIPNNVKVIVKAKLPVIKANKFRMQQLFQNLISNAVNYIEKPEGLVVIGYKEDKNNYIFYVKDNGPGIASKNKEKIFKLFQSFTQRDSSNGIGLSIVKRIVENYKGSISVESELKKGTVFYIKLPKK